MVAEQRVEARDENAAAVVVVADESCVQLAYERDPGPFDDRRGGLGLALPLARRVIEGLGGRVWSPTGDEALVRGSAIISLPLELKR